MHVHGIAVGLMALTRTQYAVHLMHVAMSECIGTPSLSLICARVEMRLVSSLLHVALATALVFGAIRSLEIIFPAPSMCCSSEGLWRTHALCMIGAVATALLENVGSVPAFIRPRITYVQMEGTAQEQFADLLRWQQSWTWATSRSDCWAL